MFVRLFGMNTDDEIIEVSDDDKTDNSEESSENDETSVNLQYRDNNMLRLDGCVVYTDKKTEMLRAEQVETLKVTYS